LHPVSYLINWIRLRGAGQIGAAALLMVVWNAIGGVLRAAGKTQPGRFFSLVLPSFGRAGAGML
jgi:hypothetical protein